MKSIFPILTLVMVATWYDLAGAQGSDAGKEVATSLEAGPLLDQALNRLRQHTSIDAKMRQTSNLFGQQVIGSGRYQQLGVGERTRFRLEWKIQVADEATRLQQVCDGRFFWVRKDSTAGARVSRVDLERIRRAVRQSGGSPKSVGVMLEQTIGGLPYLVNQLQKSFQFDRPAASMLYDVPVWVQRGSWKKELLAEMLPSQAKRILAGGRVRTEFLPEHVPDHVIVMLGQDDLFPYQIEYGRRAGDGESAEGNRHMLVTWFDVSIGGAIEPQLFEYRPGDLEILEDLEIDDQTDHWLEKLGVN